MKCHRYVCLLLQVISFVANCLAENLILDINFKKPIAVTDRAFLSFTLDPITLQHNDFIKNIEKSTNLARGLAPAYIRLGGPQSNFYNFEQVHSHEVDMDPNDMHFGTQWTLIYQWAKNAGLDVIACITPHYIDNELKTNSRDPRNIAEILSFSDRMGYNISWQLGYECQTRCDLSGEELGQYVANLHEMLKTFPRYSNSLITGPDIVAYKTAQQQKYLQDYLQSANAALSAITWHPDFNNVSLNNDNISVHYDNMIAEKDEMYKIISGVAGDKPLWIAESKPQENKHHYLDALIWTRRLGDAAKFGIQIVMKQLSDLSQATPIYWVSLLYKTLVDREVLETKLQFNNESYVHFYSQCTKPSAMYSKGAITIFGINLTPKNVTASLKGFKIKILHKYILLPDFETGNKMFSEKVLLNNKPLNLINDKNLPYINPEIIINPDGLELELPSGGIGFWIIPNAKVKACTCSEEETIKNNIVKQLSKRHKNNIQRDNREEKKEEHINQSNVIEDDVKENKSQSFLKKWKIYGKQDSKKQENVENTKAESQQKVWSSKLFAKIKKIIQKKLQKMDENKSSDLQRSFIIDLGEEQEKLSAEVKEQQNFDNKSIKKIEVDDFKSIRNTLEKHKYILLEKKAKIESGDNQHLKSEIQNIDNSVALISKINFLLYKITLNEPIMNEIKNKTKNEKESIIKMSKKLKEYLIELENSAEIKVNIIRKIEKYFNKFYNLLVDNDSTKDNKNNQVFSHEDLMKGKRFKRYLDRKSEDSKKIKTFKKHSRIDLKDHVIKQKIKRKKDDGKKLISSNNIDNSKKNFINNKNNNKNKNKYNNLLQRDPVKRFLKSDADPHIDYQHLVQEHNRTDNDNIYKKHSKINMGRYESLMQELERTKRDINRKLIEIGLKKDSASRKHSRIDDLKNYVNKRKIRQKDDIKREGLLVPFNPKIMDSNENNFYGFFRRDPVKGFPESDIFMTTGDSLEQNAKDYDYVEDDDDSNDGSEKKNTQHSQKSMLDHTEANTWVEEVENNDRDYTPNEFFENIKLSNTRIIENSKNCDDLWEAEFPFEERNNNKIIVAEIIQEQLPNEKKEKRAKEISRQHLVDYYDDSKEQEYDRDTVRPASGYPSMPFDQLLKTSTSNNNYQVSNVELKEAKFKKESESKISNSFYLPSQISTARYNYNGNYQTSSMNYDKLKEENSFVKDIGSRDDINTKTIQDSRPSMYADHSSHDKIFHNKRNKRSNWEELQKIFVQEMIKENEENAKECHRRVIRAFDSPKKLYYHRIKRNASIPTARFTDTSSENKSVSTDVAQSKKNSITREKYEEIMTGEILPSTNVIELYKENDTTTESVITELSTLDHKLSDTTQAIDVTLISEADNVSEQYHNAKKSTTNLLPIDSDSKLFLNNNNSVKYVTEKTFFRAQLPDVQSKNKTKTYDSSQVISKIPSENKDNREKLIVPITKNTQETICEKVQGFIDKKEKAESLIYSTITEDQKNEEGYNDDYKIRLKSINSLKKTKKEISEQMTTETILSKQATSTAIDNIISNESNTKSKLLQNTEDNQNSEWKARTQLEKYANTKRLKTILQNLPRTSLERLTRYEEQLTKRAEQIYKKKEKLHARRDKLLHQYQNELTKIADEQKRNLKRREAWERLGENDDFRRLIDQNFIGILLNDDVIYEDDDDNYLIPIKLVPKQYKNIIDQIYLLGKVKEMRYPEYYRNILRNLIEDDEELVETSKSSERKYNQYYEYILKRIKDTQEAKTSKFLDRERNQNCQYSSETIEDERESIETTSRSFDRKVFIIDPSTYNGGEPILQLHEDYLKLPKYHSKIKTQIQDPITRWILKNIYQVHTRLKSSEVQHQASKFQEYIEKLPIKDYAQGNGNILYVLDTRRQYDPSKELAALAHIWQNSLDRRDANQVLSNKEADELNKMHKNLEADKDNLVSTFGINEKAEFIRDFETERDMENKEFASSNNRKKNKMNSETTKDAEEDVKTKKLENIELIKQEEINKSYNLKNEAKNKLNIKMFNNNDETATHVEKIIEDDPKGKELRKENTRSQRDVGKQADKYVKRLPDFPLTENMRNKLDHIHVRLKEELKKIFDKQPTIFLLIKSDKSSNAGLFWKSKNYIVKINQQNEKEHDLNYITLIPIEIKNIYEMLDAKNNDDSLERFKIPVQWDDQYILGKIPGSMNKYLDDETSEEFEYEDLANLQSKNSESILDEESRSCENKQDISVEAEKDKQYRITKDKINKYLKIENQVGSNKHGILLLFPWRNVKKRQQRQIKNEINKDIAKIKREVTRQSQTTKLMLAKDFENTHKRSKRYYLNNNIDKEEENKIETNNIRANYLKPQTNRKNRDDLLEDFIKAHKSNNWNNNEASSIRTEEENELMPLNNVSKDDKKLLQKEISTIQNHMESMEQFVNDPEESFNDTLASDNDKHYRSKISETTGNAFHTAIMNIKDFFVFFSKISRIFLA